MPSAGFILVAVLAPIVASLFYSESAKHLLQQKVDIKTLLRMAQGTPQLAVAPYEVSQPVSFVAADKLCEPRLRSYATSRLSCTLQRRRASLQLKPNSTVRTVELDSPSGTVLITSCRLVRPRARSPAPETVSPHLGAMLSSMHLWSITLPCSIPDFLTGARYEATDGKSPKYNALYDIEDFHLFSQPKYSNLRANRSPREADLVKRLDTLDRRTCKTILDTGREDNTAKHTSPFITTLYIQPENVKDQEMKKWLTGDFVNAMKAVEGWKRTSVHEVVDSLVISAKASPQSNTAAKYLVVNGM